MNPKIIIFSKNRAIMLDALIRSIRKHDINCGIFIIYAYTDAQFMSAYGLLYNRIGQDANTVMIPENNFKDNLIMLLKHLPGKVCFMVDDDIVFRNFTFPYLFENETFSTRLHAGITNKKHFSYTFSLDGNIFNAKDIFPLIEKENFKNPNELEAAIQGKYGKQFNLSFNEASVIGFKHTRVSESSHCDYTGIYSDKELNDRYLYQNQMIDINAMNIQPEPDVHTEMPYIFKKYNTLKQ